MLEYLMKNLWEIDDSFLLGSILESTLLYNLIN